VYEYIFNADECWYKDTCKYYGSEECNGACIRYMKMHYLANNSLLTPLQQKPKSLNITRDYVDMQAYMELNNIKNNIVEFVNEGRNLVIHSEHTGNGKSLWSTKLLMKYFDSIWHTDNFSVRGLFIEVSRFLFSAKYGSLTDLDYINHIKENILTADLVVWDDIGIKDLSKAEHEYLFGFINARINNGKSNIYTTNMSSDEFKRVMGDRLFSRVFVASRVIEFKAPDQRGNKQ